METHYGMMDWNESLQQYLAILSGVTPAQWCQAFFILAAGVVLAVAAMPSDAKALLVDYGARKSPAAPAEPADQSSRKSQDRGWLLPFIATITSWTQVPHAWFGAFYVVSLTCSVFWLAQYLGDGAVLRWIASNQASARQPSATSGQVALGWLMMFLQAARRVFEHATIIKPSKSTMWVVHWLLGLFFYLFISVAVWVEGSGMSSAADGNNGETELLTAAQGAVLDDPAVRHTDDAQSLLKMAVALPAFLFAWVNQYRCHKHLAGLKKYSLPDGGMFRHYICPHYTCECLLYLSMAVATAPRGSWCNRTLLCAVAFVAVNLGVTASGTRKWYAEKFGVGPVAGKWNMIPFLF
jgi:3-oxo-5-alpha-steroid 4-dehydrogenase 3